MTTLRRHSKITRFTSLLILSYSFNFICVVQSLSTACYRIDGGVQHVSSGRGPCGVVSPNSPFYSCCTVGDQCLDNGLCHYTHEAPAGANATGYYIGGCSDPSLADPSCNPGCGDLNYQDVTFNKTSQTWLCCGAISGNVKCNDPTTETISAKALASIATTYVVPASVATGTASTTSSASSSTSVSSQTATPKPASSNSSSGTSTGAIAGGVVGGVVLIAILVGLWFFFRKARATRKRERAEGEFLMPSAQGVLNGHIEKAPDAERLELQTYENPVELDTRFEHGQTHGSNSMASELP